MWNIQTNPSHRSSLIQAFGLRALPAGERPLNLTAYFAIGNFLLAHAAMSTRFVKNYLGIDHNENPQEDLIKYGERAVTEGKMSRETLDRVKRMQAAHLNATSHLPYFVGSLVCILSAD